MIRAHMASFPPRRHILMRAVGSILPQIDRLCLCLNGYDAVPDDLSGDPRIEVLIPDRDLKDAGKFAFVAAPDDWVFTVDDDILYPPDYVQATLADAGRLDPEQSVVGHLGHVWLAQGRNGRPGWKNLLFRKRSSHLLKVDVLGTGTTCQLGRNLPRLDQIEDAAGFVDLRHACLHARAGRWLWMLPHPADWMHSLMTPDLQESSLLRSVNNRQTPPMMAELRSVFASRSPHSGLRYRQLVKQGVIQKSKRAAKDRPPDCPPAEVSDPAS
ncbi:MAG: hypothetical protein P3W94_000055 [Paracoccus sp. (in: a-proteobacteria)]|nr:hypothetical protein [Paracoccus sp. (in: a-proteobacteria)]